MRARLYALMGRRPKPTALHKLHGTYNATNHGRDRAQEPVPMGDLEEPPPDLTESQEAGWRYAIANMPKGVVKLIDRGILKVWIEAEDRHNTARLMQAMLDQDTKLKLLVKGPNGLEPSPYNVILDKCAQTMFRAAQELGLLARRASAPEALRAAARLTSRRRRARRPVGHAAGHPRWQGVSLPRLLLPAMIRAASCATRSTMRSAPPTIPTAASTHARAACERFVRDHAEAQKKDIALVVRRHRRDPRDGVRDSNAEHQRPGSEQADPPDGLAKVRL